VQVERTIFSYTSSEETELPVKLGLYAMVSKSLAAVTMSQEHIERLLKPTPLKLEGPAGQIDRPLAAIDYYNFAGVVDVIDIWVVYVTAQPGTRELLKWGIDAASSKSDEDDSDDDEDPPQEKSDEAADESKDEPWLSPEDIIADIRTVLSVLKCARGHSSATYMERGTTVTHTEWYWQDLPK